SITTRLASGGLQLCLQHGTLHSTYSRVSRNYFARLLLCGIRRAAGRREGHPATYSDAVRRLRLRQRNVHRPQCVPPSSPCKRQNRCQLEWALIQFLMAIRHVCSFHEDAGT
ncbi:ribonuclease HI, partial [Trypanosoma cruzi]